MTTPAMLPPPLERLFDRIAAAEPTVANLRALLDIWRAPNVCSDFCRRGPPWPDPPPEPTACHAFSFVPAEPPTGDWALVNAGEVAALLWLENGSWFPDSACSAIIRADVWGPSGECRVNPV